MKLCNISHTNIIDTLEIPERMEFDNFIKRFDYK